MLTIYLACLIFGGVLVAISMFVGGDSDTDADHSFGAHTEINHSLDVHANLDHSMDVHTEMVHSLAEQSNGGIDHPLSVESESSEIVSFTEAEHHALAAQQGVAVEAVRFLSFRNFVFFTAFFGLTGSVLTWLTLPAFITAMSSIGMGMTSAYGGFRFMKYLKQTETGKTLDLSDLRGHLATVTINFTKEQRGKIAVSRGDSNLQLLAIAAEEADREAFRNGETVIISRVVNGVACVIEADDLV